MNTDHEQIDNTDHYVLDPEDVDKKDQAQINDVIEVVVSNVHSSGLIAFGCKMDILYSHIRTKSRCILSLIVNYLYNLRFLLPAEWNYWVHSLH